MSLASPGRSLVAAAAGGAPWAAPLAPPVRRPLGLAEPRARGRATARGRERCRWRSVKVRRERARGSRTQTAEARPTDRQSKASRLVASGALRPQETSLFGLRSTIAYSRAARLSALSRPRVLRPSLTLCAPRSPHADMRHRASSFVGVSGFNQLEGLPEPLARHKGGPERRAPVCRRTEVRGVVEESALVAIFAASVSKVATRPCPIPRPARAAGALRETETAAGGDAGVRLGRDSGRGLGGQARNMAREHISHGVCTRGEDGGARLLLLHEATHEPLG